MYCCSPSIHASAIRLHCIQAIKYKSKWIRLGFKIQGRHQQKSKTGLISYNFFFKKNLSNYSLHINLMFIYPTWKCMWSTDIRYTFLLVYWSPWRMFFCFWKEKFSLISLILITKIGKTGIQVMFNWAWFCVVMRGFHHSTSQDYTMQP